jgi:hypothetical protein
MNDESKKTCFNCGEMGHTVPNCKKPKDNDAIEKRKKEYDANK